MQGPGKPGPGASTAARKVENWQHIRVEERGNLKPGPGPMEVPCRLEASELGSGPRPVQGKRIASRLEGSGLGRTRVTRGSGPGQPSDSDRRGPAAVAYHGRRLRGGNGAGYRLPVGAAQLVPVDCGVRVRHCELYRVLCDFKFDADR
jgi:hypothetical protein